MDTPLRRPAAADVAVALAAGAAGVGGSYAVAGFTPGFVAAPIASFAATALPGPVITVSILLLGSLGQKLNLLVAVLLAAGLLGAAAGGAAAVGRRRGWAGAAGLAAVSGAALAYALAGAPLPALGAGAGVGLVVGLSESGIERLWPGAVPDSAGRRRALKGLAAAAGVGAVGTVAGRSGGGPDGGSPRPASPRGTLVAAGDAGDVAALLAEAEEKSLDLEGMDPLVSEEFYEVDISAVNPDLAAEDWSLTVTGAVEEEIELTMEDLRSRETEAHFITLRCVGEPLNGHKMDTALWTGVPMADLLEEVTPKSGCECVMLRAADDYYEEFPLSALQRGMLAVGMNGGPLPRRHGHPARALIPGHWGEINVKWLTEIEILEREAKGYWEKRGWHGTGPVNTVAKIHAVNTLDGGRLQVGGHAYAGLRGISAVEVSTDGGDTWTEATLSDPLPGEDVWRQWKHEYDPDGPHEVVARAIEADGTVQPRERSGAFPSGPTGWVRREVEP